MADFCQRCANGLRRENYNTINVIIHSLFRCFVSWRIPFVCYSHVSLWGVHKKGGGERDFRLYSSPPPSPQSSVSPLPFLFPFLLLPLFVPASLPSPCTAFSQAFLVNAFRRPRDKSTCLVGEIVIFIAEASVLSVPLHLTQEKRRCPRDLICIRYFRDILKLDLLPLTWQTGFPDRVEMIFWDTDTGQMGTAL